MKTNELNRHLEVLDCEHCYLRDLCKGPAAVRCLLLGEAADALEGLHKRIEELEEERRWIPVTERLPEVGELVLACAEGEVAETWRESGENWATDPDCGITHWMPLPEPPGEE